MIFYFSLRLLISSLNASLSARGSGAAWVLWPNCCSRAVDREDASSGCSSPPTSRFLGVGQPVFHFASVLLPRRLIDTSRFSRVALQAHSCKHLKRTVTLEPRERNDEALQFDISAHVTGVVTTWPEEVAVAWICGPKLSECTLLVCVCVRVHTCMQIKHSGRCQCGAEVGGGALQEVLHVASLTWFAVTEIYSSIRSLSH